jgi:hypothetical protein
MRTNPKVECEVFRDRSVYPAAQTFKPTKLSLSLFAVTPMIRRLKELIDPVTPLTREDSGRSYMRGRGSGVLCSTDLRPIKDWTQVGAHWVRLCDGSHPHCHTSDRENAYVLWRMADDYYCCDGFPTFYPEAIAKMQKTMEVFKPLLQVRVDGYPVVDVALARSIRYPHGVCWGMGTLDTWYEVSVGGGDAVVCQTLTGVEKVLHTIRKDHEAENLKQT